MLKKDKKIYLYESYHFLFFLKFNIEIGCFFIKDLTKFNIGLLASKKDEAALTQAEILEEKGYKIHYLEKSVLSLKSEKELPKDVTSWIVLSKHSSVANKPSLTTHSVGNFGLSNLNLGGEDFTLGLSNAYLQSTLLSNLFQYKQDNFEKFRNFDVVCEATHHGPTIDTPLTFIEMGSSREVWIDKIVANAIVWSIIELIDEDFKSLSKIDTAIGFGGSHYPYKFAKMMIEKKFFIGHILPKYASDNLTTDIIDQMILKTIPKAKIALIDKKGIKQKGKLKEMLKDYELEIIVI